MLAGVLFCMQLVFVVSAPHDDSGSEKDAQPAKTAGSDQGAWDGTRRQGTQSSPLRQGQPISKLHRKGIRRYLEDRGISVQDIPKALVVYEGISMGLLCVAQPTFLDCMFRGTTVVIRFQGD